jgi:hypothetical protein
MNDQRVSAELVQYKCSVDDLVLEELFSVRLYSFDGILGVYKRAIIINLPW